jgi:hypothetical protein
MASDTPQAHWTRTLAVAARAAKVAGGWLWKDVASDPDAALKPERILAVLRVVTAARQFREWDVRLMGPSQAGDDLVELDAALAAVFGERVEGGGDEQV